MTERASNRLPLSVTTDLSRELGDRVRKSTYAMTDIVDDHLDRFEITTGGLSLAIAMSAGFLSAAAGRKFDPIDVGIALLEEMRAARTARDTQALIDRVTAKLGKKS
jgi:hypothetical protein